MKETEELSVLCSRCQQIMEKDLENVFWHRIDGKIYCKPCIKELWEPKDDSYVSFDGAIVAN